MTRRKSRPLLPHEVASFRSSQESVEDATHSSFSIDEGSQQQPWSSQSSIQLSQSPPEQKHILPQVKTSKKEKSPNDLPETKRSDVSPLGIATASTETSAVTGSTVGFAKAPAESSENTTSFPQGPLAISGIPDIPTVQKSSARRGSHHMANRRSAPFSIYQESNGEVPPPAIPLAAPNSVLPSSNPELKMSLSLKRTSSVVRLSMSLDGKAKVTTGDESSPSPPRTKASPGVEPGPRRKTGLQRSQSALEPNNKTPMESILSSSMNSRRPMTGRSRDARTWEFYCDSDARNALTIQAEREQSGSAAGAIGLIRSRSNKTLTVNSNKRNAHQLKHESMKRLKSDGQQLQKPKLARATSSVARLQNITGNAQKQVVKSKDKDPKSASQPAMYQHYEGDSDKENWEPGTQTSNIRRRRPVTEHNPRMRRPVLEESLHIPSQSSSLDTLMNQNVAKNRRLSREASSEKENSGSEEDEQIEKFMSGSSVPREVEDLDCVQNLLSLSQAAWQ